MAESEHGGHSGHEVKITIDKQHLKSPEHTTGSALYALGHVPAGFDLYLEIKGPGDDDFIANDASKVHVREGNHYYTAKSTLNPGTLR